ncbi:MAG: leucine--tRNA ligase [Firmicutes bacterium]|nr:leucine--tRNA ligase [Bacillota bacterium]
MEEKYQPQQIEQKWQKRWQEAQLFRAEDFSPKPKLYALDFFPYPSGDGLSVGHCRNYIPTDAFCRYKHMKGFNVLHPMGWDAFGLPAENEAIRKRSHPSKTVPRYIANYKRQMNMIGISYDWSREINSSSPDYYKWTQWFFLLLYKRGLAYRSTAPANWCPSCKTVLANEEVEGGACWRCGSMVEKRDLPQWFFKITDYAERLLNDLELINWPEGIKMMQRNWIGRSEGVEFEMQVADAQGKPSGKSFRVFTTRVDTTFGMSFAVLAPEHPLVREMTTPDRREEVEAYIARSQRETEIERLSTERVRDGVFTGAYAINPVNGQLVPIFIADYVLMGYGTGAIMAVPAHDERDFDFAKRYGLPIPVVIAPPGWNGEPLEQAYTGEGTMVNSGEFSGLPSEEGKKRIADWMEERGIGKRRVNYRLRDWLISRQRYWGAPIPIIHCPKCGEVAVPEDQLPVLLPDVEHYEPTGTGKSPLANIPEFVNTSCPQCGGAAERETDTMGGFACSSWYFLRFASPHETDRPFNPDAVRYWLPVDVYVGGAEHAVMHLLYARFWVKVMYDAGLVHFVEPFMTLRNQGMVLAPDPDTPDVMVKMSKSKGNVVTPDAVVEKHGADTLRLYELFVAPFDQAIEWREEGVSGANRFLHRVWRLVLDAIPHYHRDWKEKLQGAELSADERKLRRKTHQTIKKVGEDIEEFRFNTAVAAVMEWVNLMYDLKDSLIDSPAFSEAIHSLILVLAPFTPHIADELWERLGYEGFTYNQPYPEYDEAVAAAEELNIVVQVNGKLRDVLVVPVDTPQEELERLALSSPKVQQFTNGKTVKKVIVVPNKLVNVVVG